MTATRPTATLTGDVYAWREGAWVVIIYEGTLVDVLARPYSGEAEAVIAHGATQARVHPGVIGDTAFAYSWETE